MIITGAGKKFQRFDMFVWHAFEAKFLYSRLTAMPTLIFAHEKSKFAVNVVEMFQKIKGALLATSLPFLSPVMLNLSRNNNRNKTVYRGGCL